MISHQWHFAWGIIRHAEESSQGEGGGAVSRVLFKRSKRLDGHLSGMTVTCHLMQPTRGSNGPGQASPPIWPCSDWGLPCHACCQVVRWALTPPFHPYLPSAGGMFSVALTIAFQRPGVTWQSTLRSSDFPRPGQTGPRPSRPTTNSNIVPLIRGMKTRPREPEVDDQAFDAMLNGVDGWLIPWR